MKFNQKINIVKSEIKKAAAEDLNLHKSFNLIKKKHKSKLILNAESYRKKTLNKGRIEKIFDKNDFLKKFYEDLKTIDEMSIDETIAIDEESKNHIIAIIKAEIQFIEHNNASHVLKQKQPLITLLFEKQNNIQSEVLFIQVFKVKLLSILEKLTQEDRQSSSGDKKINLTF
jgi:hypothetical protein